MGNRCCLEQTTPSEGFAPFEPSFPPFKKHSGQVHTSTSIVSHSPKPYTMIVTRTSMPRNDQPSEHQQELKEQGRDRAVYSFRKDVQDEIAGSLQLSERDRRHSGTSSINTKLNRHEHRFFVVAPSLDNESVIRRLQYEDPHENMFTGIPSMDGTCQKRQRQSYSHSVGPQRQSLFYKATKSFMK